MNKLLINIEYIMTFTLYFFLTSLLWYVFARIIIKYYHIEYNSLKAKFYSYQGNHNIIMYYLR
jgi:hypothetical protein